MHSVGILKRLKSALRDPSPRDRLLTTALRWTPGQSSPARGDILGFPFLPRLDPAPGQTGFSVGFSYQVCFTLLCCTEFMRPGKAQENCDFFESWRMEGSTNAKCMKINIMTFSSQHASSTVDLL